MNYYKTIDELPIYNYFKIVQSGELIYMFVDVNDKRNKVNDNVRRAWEDINYQLPEGAIDLEPKRKNVKMWLDCNHWIATKDVRHENNYNASFAEYKLNYGNKPITIDDDFCVALVHNDTPEYLLDPFVALYYGKKYRTFNIFYDNLRKNENLTVDFVYKLRAYLLETFILLENGNENSGDFMDEIVSIEHIIGFSIDSKTTSVAKYFSYRKLATQIIKEREKHGRQD